MARRRFQNPEPELVGRWWQIRVYRDEYFNGRRIRVRKRIRLAPASVAIREVQKIKAEYLRPLNQGLVSEGSATPFEGFVQTVYAVTELPRMASSTQDRYKGIIDNYLIPTFGSASLRDLTQLALQKYILGFQIKEHEESENRNDRKDGSQKGLSRESVDKIRMCCPASWVPRSSTGSSSRIRRRAYMWRQPSAALGGTSRSYDRSSSQHWSS